MSEQIPVEKIKSSPFQARKVFEDTSIQELAQAIKEEGLIQLLTVRRVNDGFFELIAGERRLRAVKLLGWQTVEALIMDNVSDQQAATKGLIENLQREDLNPIEQANGYKQLEAMGLTQEAIAQKVGKSQPVIAKTLALLEMPTEIQEIIPRGIITETHCRALRQIPDKTKQIELAQKADKEAWSVKETEKRVKDALGKSAKGDKAQKDQPETPVDPLAEVWESVKQTPNLTSAVHWELKYGIHKPHPKISEAGYFLFIAPLDPTSKTDLGNWFMQVGQALTGQTVQEVLPESSQSILEAQARVNMISRGIKPPTKDQKRVAQKAADLWLPKSEEEARDQAASPLVPKRLPNTPQEWSEVEALAKAQGPGGVYEWALGAESYWTKKAKAMSWQDLEVSDPVAGCHKLLEGLKRSLAVVASPVESPEDAEARRKADEIEAKYGRIL